MRFEKKKAILFDLDGTLVDSVPDLAAAVNEMLRRLGREGYDEETVRYWVGNGAQILVRRALLGKRDIDGETIETDLFEKAMALFFDAYAAHLSRATRPYPYVMGTLSELKKAGYKTAIVTNKPERFALPLAERLGMADLFDAIYGGDRFEKKKPDPLPLVRMCENLGVAIDDAVMVGDSRNDILAAKACGMPSIGVTYGYNYGESISRYKPDAVVNAFDEIASLFTHKK